MILQFQNLLRKLRAIASLVFNVIQLIAALIALLATTAGATIAAGLLRIEWLIAPLIAFALGIIITLTIIFFFAIKSSPSRWLLRGYRYVHAEYLYRIYDEPKHHSLTVSVLLEAIQSGVSIFEDRYLWSGQGEEGEPQLTSPGCSLMGSVIKRSGWKYYYIHMGRELSLGERQEITTYQDLYDHDNKFEPYLAKTIAEPVDQLVLRVILPKHRIPTKATLSEWSTLGPASTRIKTQPGKINTHSGEIHWEIASPVFGHRYEIRWE